MLGAVGRRASSALPSAVTAGGEQAIRTTLAGLQRLTVDPAMRSVRLPRVLRAFEKRGRRLDAIDQIRTLDLRTVDDASPALAWRLLPRRAADLGGFTEEELASVDDVLEQLGGMSGTQVSELSHQEPGWRLTEIGETIPFATAFLDFPQVATEVSARLESEVAERYGFADAG